MSLGGKGLHCMWQSVPKMNCDMCNQPWRTHTAWHLEMPASAVPRRWAVPQPSAFMAICALCELASLIAAIVAFVRDDIQAIKLSYHLYFPLRYESTWKRGKIPGPMSYFRAALHKKQKKNGFYSSQDTKYHFLIPQLGCYGGILLLEILLWLSREKPKI